MSDIYCETKPSPAKLDVLGVYDWPVWKKEVSEFPWVYDKIERCYIIKGKVVVTPDGEESITFSRGDLITFPAGLSCTWNIIEPIEKYYAFD